MEFSILLAKIFAAIYLAAGLGLLINPKFYPKIIDDMVKNTAVLYLYGFIAIVGGVFMVSYHNIWEKSWVVIITLFGWAALLKGFMILIFPKSLVICRPMFKMRLFSIVAFIIAAFFGYFGFFA